MGKKINVVAAVVSAVNKLVNAVNKDTSLYALFDRLILAGCGAQLVEAIKVKADMTNVKSALAKVDDGRKAFVSVLWQSTVAYIRATGELPKDTKTAYEDYRAKKTTGKSGTRRGRPSKATDTAVKSTTETLGEKTADRRGLNEQDLLLLSAIDAASVKVRGFRKMVQELAARVTKDSLGSQPVLAHVQAFLDGDK